MILTIVIMLVFYFIHIYLIKSAVKLINIWAKNNNYIIDKIEYRYLWKGPFFSGVITSFVFKISISTKYKKKTDAWVRVGGNYMGMIFSKKINIIFE